MFFEKFGGGKVKTKTFYEAVECGGIIENANMLLDNPRSKEEGLRWTRFKTYEDAKRRIEKAILSRKNQWFYFEDKDHNVKNKISYYERYRITYKIYKVVEQVEKVFTCDNSDIQLKEETNKELQEYTTL